MTAPAATTLLHRFDFPRETPAGADAAADTLVTILRSEFGLDPIEVVVRTHPGRDELATSACLVAAVVCSVVARRTARDRVRGVLGVMLAGLGIAVASLTGGLDRMLPSTPARQIEVTMAPRDAALREVILGAHYDSKTQVVDHVGRAALGGFAVAAFVLAAIVSFAAQRSRLAAACAAAGCIATAGVCGAGSFIPGPRSHGITDNAAACAILLEIAATTAAQPLTTTRVRCVFWSDEEQGAQGSAGWVRAAAFDDLPRSGVNLECIGAGDRIGYLAREWTGLRWIDAPVEIADAARSVIPTLVALPYPGVTDGGSLRRAGIDAITLIGLETGARAPRGLHRPTDGLESVDRQGVASTTAFLQQLLARIDQGTR